MKKAFTVFFSLVAVIVIAVSLNGCGPNFEEIETCKIDSLYRQTLPKEQPLLDSHTTLYVDHSTCVIEALANNKSSALKDIKGNLGCNNGADGYINKLVLIKGVNFYVVPSDSDYYRVLSNIKNGIPYADVESACNQIEKDSCQSILITDAEYWKNGMEYIDKNYMTGALTGWLSNGHSVYVVVEPYQESVKIGQQIRLCEKKRFYFMFTDDRLEVPISNNLLACIKDRINRNECSVFHFTNSDIKLILPEKEKLMNNELCTEINYKEGYEYIQIDDSWDLIKEYVMKLDSHDRLIEGEKPESLIKNIKIRDGEVYSLADIEIKATNLTGQYYEGTDAIDVSDCFAIDKEEFKKDREIKIMLTQEIFDNPSLSNGYGCNLIRLDVIAKEVTINDEYNENSIKENFEWVSPFQIQNKKSTCVSNSFINALKDINVIPQSNRSKEVILHTFYLNMQEIK